MKNKIELFLSIYDIFDFYKTIYMYDNKVHIGMRGKKIFINNSNSLGIIFVNARNPRLNLTIYKSVTQHDGYLSLQR